MRTLAWVAGLVLAILILRDIFNALMVPGRVRRPLRFVPLYFHLTWRLCATVGRRLKEEQRREKLFSLFGPSAMLLLLILWAGGLLVAFGLLEFGVVQHSGSADFAGYVYISGARIFTLGAEQPAHSGGLSKALAIIEAGTGLGFMTMVIAYLPVLYQLYARRETHVILLDERAGTPVSVASLICNHARRNAVDRLNSLLAVWEQWSSELLESHVSYVMMSYYRSQHSDHSWLAATAIVMDTCALGLSGVGLDEFQAERTLAMCTTAIRNVSEMLQIRPLRCYPDRLPPGAFHALVEQLRLYRIPVADGDVWGRLSEIRSEYEPLLAAMADYFVIELPAWISQ